jgi:hypothetical protein
MAYFCHSPCAAVTDSEPEAVFLFGADIDLFFWTVTVKCIGFGSMGYKKPKLA